MPFKLNHMHTIMVARRLYRAQHCERFRQHSKTTTRKLPGEAQGWPNWAVRHACTHPHTSHSRADRVYHLFPISGKPEITRTHQTSTAIRDLTLEWKKLNSGSMRKGGAWGESHSVSRNSPLIHGNLWVWSTPVLLYVHYVPLGRLCWWCHEPERLADEPAMQGFLSGFPTPLELPSP